MAKYRGKLPVPYHTLAVGTLPYPTALWEPYHTLPLLLWDRAWGWGWGETSARKCRSRSKLPVQAPAELEEQLEFQMFMSFHVGAEG